METMLGVKPKRLDLRIENESVIQGDVSGIIGFAEKDVMGAVALSFPENTAIYIYKKVTGDTLNRISMEVQDIVGELANIVAGGAKKEFSEMGHSFMISIPTVVVGRNHTLGHKFGVPLVIVPFEMGKYKFSMEVSMKLLPIR